MKKIIILGLVLIAIIISVTGYLYLESVYNKKLIRLQAGESIGYRQLDEVLSGFYALKGEFPEGIVHDADYEALLQQNLVSAPILLLDEFTSDREKFVDYIVEKDEKSDQLIVKGKTVKELAYYPIYNRNNRKRESFVLLSAGIDGNFDNVVSDTLYMDSWWTQLRLYNLEEVMADTFYKQAFNILYIKTSEHAAYIEKSPNGTILQCRKSSSPKFSIFQYWFGQKDYVVRYGLPYYIYFSRSNDEIFRQRL